MKKEVDKRWASMRFFDSSVSTTTKYRDRKFLKIDLGHNGFTDLIINGRYLLAVTDNGNNGYKVHFISKASFTYLLLDI